MEDVVDFGFRVQHYSRFRVDSYLISGRRTSDCTCLGFTDWWSKILIARDF